MVINWEEIRVVLWRHCVAIIKQERNLCATTISVCLSVCLFVCLSLRNSGSNSRPNRAVNVCYSIRTSYTQPFMIKSFTQSSCLIIRSLIALCDSQQLHWHYSHPWKLQDKESDHHAYYFEKTTYLMTSGNRRFNENRVSHALRKKKVENSPNGATPATVIGISPEYVARFRLPILFLLAD